MCLLSPPSVSPPLLPPSLPNRPLARQWPHKSPILLKIFPCHCGGVSVKRPETNMTGTDAISIKTNLNLQQAEHFHKCLSSSSIPPVWNQKNQSATLDRAFNEARWHIKDKNRGQEHKRGKKKKDKYEQEGGKSRFLGGQETTGPLHCCNAHTCKNHI